MYWYCLLWVFVRAFFVYRANLAMENLALRQQLAIMNRMAARPLSLRWTTPPYPQPSSWCMIFPRSLMLSRSPLM